MFLPRRESFDLCEPNEVGMEIYDPAERKQSAV